MNSAHQRTRIAPLARLATALLLAGVLPSLAALTTALLFGSQPHVHAPLHEGIELIGSCIGIMVAMLLVMRSKYDTTAPHVLWVALALVAMAIADGVHGVLPFGPAFAWTRHGATFAGGLMFALVWLPTPAIAVRRPSMLLSLVAGLAMASALLLWWRPDLLPAPFLRGGFSLSAKVANGVGGLGFLAAAVFFLRRYLRQPQSEDLVFASHTLLFANASLLFGYTHVWAAEWWVRHGFRLLAYAILLRSAHQTVSSLYRQITRHAEGLEARVRVRTEELAASNTRLEAEVRERERADRLAAIIASSGDAIISKTLDGTITSWNHGAAHLFGYSAAEAIGKPMLMLFPPERAQKEPDILARLGRGERIDHPDTEHVRKDGKRIAVSAIISPLHDAGGRIIGGATIARDITQQKAVIDALQQSESRFRSLVTATAQIVWYTSAEGTVSGPLPSLQDYTGQTEEEIQGAGWGRALHPDDVARTMGVWRRAVEARSLFELDYRIRRRDGVYRDFTVRGAPVLNEDGSLREWVGTCTDITEQKRAELEREQFFTLSLDLMCIARSDGYFHRLNPAFQATLGFSEEELLQRPFVDFIHPDDVAATLRVMETLKFGVEMINFENRYLCKDGSYRHFLWSCAPDPAGMLYATARDITERKQAEEYIRSLNENLEKRVTERTAQLEAANKELEAFSYSVSHDLRAPLRSVDSFARIVLEDYGEKLDAEGNRLLGVVCGEAKRMGQLIDDLLDFSRMGRQELTTGLVNMSALAREVFDDLAPVLREHVRYFDVKRLPDAAVDRSMFRQVFVNLIGNAVKFTSRAAESAIEIGCTTADGMHTYYVKDNGAGFDERYLLKLFGVFQRLHGEHEFEGTGVGLAVVQRIVHRHGGRVWAEGKINQGATFYFALPAKEDSPV